MPVSIQRLPRQGLSPCPTLHPAASSVPSTILSEAARFQYPAATYKAEKSSGETLTIVFAIIGAILTLVSVVVALLQYRLQLQRVRDAEEDGHVLPITLPQRPRPTSLG